MKILNAQGQPITLSDREKKIVNHNQAIVNSLGVEVSITTLTAISKKISEQKFFHIKPADYLPVIVGEGAWSSSIETFRSYELGDDFEKGNINSGAGNDRLSSVDAAVDSVNLKVINWGKTISWALPEIEQAAKAGNWDLVTSRERARKKNWDLGIQKMAFLGSASNTAVKGLYTLSGVTNNTALITKKISTMSGTELKAFCQAIIGVYRANNNFTAWPTHFILPETDYTGLASPSNADFNIKSVLAVLQETFAIMTMNPGFKILPNAYGDSANNGLGVNRYVMLNYDEESLNMHIPVDYTNTLANSVNNFQWQNAAYGQYTGVQAVRPLEIMHFSF